MARDATWTNSDGLVVGFGTHTVDNNVPGVYQGANGRVTVIMEITCADLPDTYAATNTPPQAVTIPRGSIINSAFLHTIVAPTSGGAATLDIGTWSYGLATEVVDDADGIVADATVAEMGVIGEGILLDGPMIADAATAASTVATVGATSNSDCVIAPSYETAVFTAGLLRLHLTYTPPGGSAGRTVAA